MLLSANPAYTNDELVRSMLTKYFLGAFNENEHYHFTHLSDGYERSFNYVNGIFDNKNFVQQSALLAHFFTTKAHKIKGRRNQERASLKEVPGLAGILLMRSHFKKRNKRNIPESF